MSNEVTPFEEKGAYFWFFGIGAFAIALVVALVQIDNGLINSPREVNLNNTLKEIRSAQASFETRNLDSRLLVTESVHESK